ncbi:MAG TPA: M48 family metalloprotease [Myxococcota bacterium]
MRRRRGHPLVAGLLFGLVLFQPACATLSVPEEQALGSEAERELRKQLDFVRDESVLRYVEGIGREIVAASGPQPYPYNFYVVDDEQLNAFALPAGYIYMHTAIIHEAANVSELAGVMAHEVGHVALRHVARNYNRQRNTGLLYQVFALGTSIFVGGQAAAAGQLLGQLAAVAYVNQFTREAEAEADAFAVEVLPRAGYHPEGLVSFFETLRRQGGPHVPEFLSSHPTTERRIDETRGLIGRTALPPGLKVTDGGELKIVQRRLELLAAGTR